MELFNLEARYNNNNNKVLTQSNFNFRQVEVYYLVSHYNATYRKERERCNHLC